MLVAELGMPAGIVATDAEDDAAMAREFLFVVAEVYGFAGAERRVPGVKE